MTNYTKRTNTDLDDQQMDPSKDSTSANQFLPSQFNDVVSKVASMIPDGCGMIIIPHDFELSLEQASFIMNTTPELLELMLENSNTISPNQTVLAQDILKFKTERSDAKEKSFKKTAKSKAHLFGIE